jgi:SHS2 domain-containing protein
MGPESSFIPFEQVEHTADLAYLVRGRSPEELLENAALGLASFLVEPATVRALEEESIELEGSDAEECLVTWLQEILYRLEMRHRLYGRFRVHRAGPPRVSARVWGEAFDPERHHLLADIKAATYHALKIVREETPSGALYQVRIVLDI